MNFGSNAAYDLASEREQKERDAKIAEASRALRQIGTYQCDGCGIDLSRERRLAYPAATRCVRCQTKHEKKAAR